MPAGPLMDRDEVLFAAKLPINLEETMDTIVIGLPVADEPTIGLIGRC